MQKKILFLSIWITIAVVIYVLCDVAWLGVMLVLGYFIYSVLTMKRVKECKGIYAVLKVVGITLVIFSIAISARLLFFEVYTIPSSSMEAALMPGDVVWVNKLPYGPRLPSSPFQIPWINLLFYLNANARQKMDDTWWGYKRLAGFSKLKQGDVIVCTRFKDQKIPFIKRCVGAPGEYLQVKDGTLVNPNEVATDHVLIPVTIASRRLVELRKILDSLGVDLGKTGIRDAGDRNKYSFRIPQHLVSHLRHHRSIDSLYVSPPKPEIESYYLKGANAVWGIYNFGPFAIPKKEDEIELNELNFALYAQTIHEFEGNEIIQNDGKFILDGKPVTKYTFQNDYFFLMGDNREDSQDSRYYGFVPTQNIIGKADVILFSVGEGEFDWKRLFKNL